MINMKKFKNSVGAVAMTLALSACMPTDNASNEVDSSREFLKSQSKIYAQSLQQYGARSQDLLMSTSTWVAGSISNGALINVAALGGDFGAADEYTQSGYCVIDTANPTSAMHLTWFDEQDADGNFVLKGVGAGNSGHIIRALREHVSGNNLGIKDGANVKLVSTGAAQALPADCAGFNIPEGSPVLMFNIRIPQTMDESVVNTEYRTAACASGMEGHMIQSLNVTSHPDGSISAGGVTLTSGGSFDTPIYDYLWQEHSDNCVAPVVMASLTSRTIEAQGVDLSALIESGNAGTAGNIVNNRLNEIDCKEAEQVAAEDAETESEDEVAEGFSTCSSSVDVAALQSIGEVYVEVDRVENVTKPCGGTSGNFTDRLSGFIGNATHVAWEGEAKYRREILRHSLDDDLTSVSDDNRKFRERWEGVSLECEREEAMNFTCASVYPQFGSSFFSVVDNRGFNYRRTNRITDWADKIALTPKEPTDPNWNFRAGQSGCEWLETETWGCNGATVSASAVAAMERAIGGAIRNGSWASIALEEIDEEGLTDEEIEEARAAAVADRDAAQAREDARINGVINNLQRAVGAAQGTMEVSRGRRTRDIKVSRLGAEPGVAAWETHSPARCLETRTTGGCQRITSQRTFTSNAPGEGSWSGWTAIAWTDECGGGSGGGEGGGAGGGDNCLLAGTQIAMADGTTKSVELLEAGDLTTAGRVLQTFKRSYDAGSQTSLDLFMRAGGLYEHDGVVGTGRHPLHAKGQWIELAELDQAAPVDASDVKMVYNFLMENHILPVVGDSGTVYEYADDLNNLNNTAEAGRLKLAAQNMGQLAAE